MALFWLRTQRNDKAQLQQLTSHTVLAATSNAAHLQQGHSGYQTDRQIMPASLLNWKHPIADEQQYCTHQPGNVDPAGHLRYCIEILSSIQHHCLLFAYLCLIHAPSEYTHSVTGQGRQHSTVALPAGTGAQKRPGMSVLALAIMKLYQWCFAYSRHWYQSWIIVGKAEDKFRVPQLRLP